MQRNLIIAPDSILRKKSTPVVLDKKLIEFAKDLSDTLFKQDKPKGVGLSAPQIGKNWQMFATMLSLVQDQEPTTKDIVIFINPKITKNSGEFTLGDDVEDPILEGCLSIPKLYGPIPRYTWVEIEYETIDAFNPSHQLKKTEARYTDFLARVIQHEQDHLNGVLFLDYSFKLDLPIYQQRGRSMIPAHRDVVQALL